MRSGFIVQLCDYAVMQFKSLAGFACLACHAGQPNPPLTPPDEGIHLSSALLDSYILDVPIIHHGRSTLREIKSGIAVLQSSGPTNVH